MKGIVRKIDDTGRVVPPKEFRTALGIGEYDPVDIYLDGRRICIEPAMGCILCDICAKPIDCNGTISRELRLCQKHARELSQSINQG